MNLVLLGATQFVLSQTGCHGISEIPENLKSETVLSDAGDKHNFGPDYHWRIEERWSKDHGQIVNSRLGIRYSDLMNIYKGRSLQLVKAINSGRLFWSPAQSVLKKPFENDVFS